MKRLAVAIGFLISLGALTRAYYCGAEAPKLIPVRDGGLR